MGKEVMVSLGEMALKPSISKADLARFNLGGYRTESTTMQFLFEKRDTMLKMPDKS
jgi:hypothetical protein